MDDDVKHVMQFFKYDHLPSHLQEVSKPFYEIAVIISENRELTHIDRAVATDVIHQLPNNRERRKSLINLHDAFYAVGTINCLDFLLAAKDAAVRAKLAK